ncbi:hypothetical protein BGZ95_003084, partial [Linnemannia exigua]
VPVWAVLDYTGHKIIQRELLLVKVSILGPEHVLAQMKSRRTSLPSATDLRTLQQQQKVQQDWDNEIEIMSPSAALRQTHDHLHALTELTELFQGKVVDVSSDSVGETGSSERVLEIVAAFWDLGGCQEWDDGDAQIYVASGSV